MLQGAFGRQNDTSKMDGIDYDKTFALVAALELLSLLLGRYVVIDGNVHHENILTTSLIAEIYGKFSAEGP